jgi:hypothetical protein
MGLLAGQYVRTRCCEAGLTMTVAALPRVTRSAELPDQALWIWGTWAIILFDGSRALLGL